jgi:integrase
MRLRHLDLESGWLTYPRVKTETERRVPLWPETVQALTEWLAVRPRAKDPADADLVFVTTKGHGWTADLYDRPITKETRKFLDRLGINGRRNFYACRHTFETIGGEAHDQVAVDAIMGHDDGSMASQYRERVSDERLSAVVNHVRAWLFGKTATTNLEAMGPATVE